MEKTKNTHHRGLHMVIINSENGKVETAKVFDTYKSSKEFDEFTARDLPYGHIVVAACKDDCVTNMSAPAMAWFEEMGSREIWNLKYR